MRSPSSIGVDDNFSSGQTCICLRTTNIKFTRGIDNNFRILKHILWDNLFNDLLSQGISNGLIVSVWMMLGRNKNVINPDWLHLAIWLWLILNNDLGFTIGSQPWDCSTVSLYHHLLANFVCKIMRIRMERLFIPLISGIPEH
jgi:hypothetical protein